MADSILQALGSVRVFIETDSAVQETRATWSRVDRGYAVEARVGSLERVAILTCPDEIDFAATSGANLYLRLNNWRMYSHGIRGKYEDEMFIPRSAMDRVPAALRGGGDA